MADAPLCLGTPRLRLRPVEASDADAIGAIASRREVADTMATLPHPYPPGEAARWIAERRAARDRGLAASFVAELRDAGASCGVAEIHSIEPEHRQAELSFWLAPDAWGRGYMSEIVPALVAHAFGALGLNRLYAHHMLRNPASGRVLEKAGFRREGVLRQRVRKWGRYEDVALCALLADDWRAGATDA